MLSMQEIRVALRGYHADHDAYPASLQELEGAYLEMEPVCPISGAPYGYEVGVDGYMLSCPNPGEHGALSISASDDKIPHYEAAEQYDEGLSAGSR
jgi:hypothetical protein